MPVPRFGFGGSSAAPRPALDDGGPAAASTALPTPAQQPACRRRTSVAWRPIYVPTLGAASASWLRRLGPASMARSALPAEQLADVGTACGAVARALWVVGDAAGGGFPAYLSACVKERYGSAVGKAAASAGAALSTHAAERAEAAGVVEELASLVGACLAEALAGLGSARATWRTGCAPPTSLSEATLTSRWSALRHLQDAQRGMGAQRSAFDAAEEATLSGVERWHARAAAHTAAEQPPTPPSPGLIPLPPPRLPNTLEASAVSIRWLAVLFGLGEVRRGLEELAAAVEALGSAAALACGVGKGEVGMDLKA